MNNFQARVTCIDDELVGEVYVYELEPQAPGAVTVRGQVAAIICEWGWDDFARCFPWLPGVDYETVFKGELVSVLGQPDGIKIIEWKMQKLPRGVLV